MSKKKLLIILVILISVALILFFIAQFIFKKITIAPTIENNSISTTTVPFKGPVGPPKIIGPSSPPPKY